MGDGGELSQGLNDVPSQASTPIEVTKKKQKGMVGRIWSAMGLVGHLFFRSAKEDFEKRLQHLSKEELAAHNRLKRRTQLWRKFARNLILYSVVAEGVILGIAIYSTKGSEIDWQTRAWRVFPVFALPLATISIYTSCAKFYRMRERYDQKTLERLRSERQIKLDELKEKTNYYLTQQLIQKYDLDPTAKAAAAQVLASKLGTESGLKFMVQGGDVVEEDSGKSSNSGRRKEQVEQSGLRNRRTPAQGDQSSVGLQRGPQGRLVAPSPDRLGREVNAQEPYVEVEHHNGGNSNNGGWIARIAAVLVGEDPSQCYALICGKCHMHNGLARKEDYQYITYYCPHCHALNNSAHLEASEASEATDQSAGVVDTPRNQSSRPEEVFSTSGGYLEPGEDSLSNSALATSRVLATTRVLETLQEPQEILSSDIHLSDT